MEDIEYLDEYKDLVLPGIKSNESRSKTRRVSSESSGSSSIDADVFENLFYDKCIEDELLVKDGPKSRQRRRYSSTSSDSNDAYETLFNTKNSKSKNNLRERFDSIDDLGIALKIRHPANKTFAQKPSSSYIAAKKTPKNNRILGSSSSVSSKPLSGAVRGRPPLNKRIAQKAKISVPTNPKIPLNTTKVVPKITKKPRQPIRSSSSKVLKKPATIVRPQNSNLQPRKNEPKKDPLNLVNFFTESTSDEYEDETDYSDTDEYDPERIIDISTDTSTTTTSVADDVTPVVSEDEDQQQLSGNNERLTLYLNNLSSAEAVTLTPLSKPHDKNNLRSSEKRARASTTPKSSPKIATPVLANVKEATKDAAVKAMQEESIQADSTTIDDGKSAVASKKPKSAEKSTVGHRLYESDASSSRIDIADESLTYEKLERMSLEVAEQLVDIDMERTMEFERRSSTSQRNCSKDRLVRLSSHNSYVRQLSYADEESDVGVSSEKKLRRVKSDSGLPKKKRGRPPKNRASTTEEIVAKTKTPVKQAETKEMEAKIIQAAKQEGATETESKNSEEIVDTKTVSSSERVSQSKDLPRTLTDNAIRKPKRGRPFKKRRKKLNKVNSNKPAAEENRLEQTEEIVSSDLNVIAEAEKVETATNIEEVIESGTETFWILDKTLNEPKTEEVNLIVITEKENQEIIATSEKESHENTSSKEKQESITTLKEKDVVIEAVETNLEIVSPADELVETEKENQENIATVEKESHEITSPKEKQKLIITLNEKNAVIEAGETNLEIVSPADEFVESDKTTEKTEASVNLEIIIYQVEDKAGTPNQETESSTGAAHQNLLEIHKPTTTIEETSSKQLVDATEVVEPKEDSTETAEPNQVTESSQEAAHEESFQNILEIHKPTTTIAENSSRQLVDATEVVEPKEDSAETMENTAALALEVTAEPNQKVSSKSAALEESSQNILEIYKPTTTIEEISSKQLVDATEVIELKENTAETMENTAALALEVTAEPNQVTESSQSAALEKSSQNLLEIHKPTITIEETSKQLVDATEVVELKENTAETMENTAALALEVTDEPKDDAEAKPAPKQNIEDILSAEVIVEQPAAEVVKDIEPVVESSSENSKPENAETQFQNPLKTESWEKLDNAQTEIIATPRGRSRRTARGGINMTVSVMKTRSSRISGKVEQHGTENLTKEKSTESELPQAMPQDDKCLDNLSTESPETKKQPPIRQPRSTRAKKEVTPTARETRQSSKEKDAIKETPAKSVKRSAQKNKREPKNKQAIEPAEAEKEPTTVLHMEPAEVEVDEPNMRDLLLKTPSEISTNTAMSSSSSSTYCKKLRVRVQRMIVQGSNEKPSELETLSQEQPIIQKPEAVYDEKVLLEAPNMADAKADEAAEQPAPSTSVVVEANVAPTATIEFQLGEENVKTEINQPAADSQAVPDKSSSVASEDRPGDTAEASETTTGVTTSVEESAEKKVNPKRSLRKREAEATQLDEAPKRKQTLANSLLKQQHAEKLAKVGGKVTVNQIAAAKPVPPTVRRRKLDDGAPMPPLKRSKLTRSVNTLLDYNVEVSEKSQYYAIVAKEVAATTSAKAMQSGQASAVDAKVDKPSPIKTTTAISDKPSAIKVAIEEVMPQAMSEDIDELVEPAQPATMLEKSAEITISMTEQAAANSDESIKAPGAGEVKADQALSTEATKQIISAIEADPKTTPQTALKNDFDQSKPEALAAAAKVVENILNEGSKQSEISDELSKKAMDQNEPAKVDEPMVTEAPKQTDNANGAGKKSLSQTRIVYKLSSRKFVSPAAKDSRSMVTENAKQSESAADPGKKAMDETEPEKVEKSISEANGAGKKSLSQTAIVNKLDSGQSEAPAAKDGKSMVTKGAKQSETEAESGTKAKDENEIAKVVESINEAPKQTDNANGAGKKSLSQTAIVNKLDSRKSEAPAAKDESKDKSMVAKGSKLSKSAAVPGKKSLGQTGGIVGKADKSLTKLNETTTVPGQKSILSQAGLNNSLSLRKSEPIKTETKVEVAEKKTNSTNPLIIPVAIVVAKGATLTERTTETPSQTKSAKQTVGKSSSSSTGTPTLAAAKESPNATMEEATAAEYSSSDAAKPALVNTSASRKRKVAASTLPVTEPAKNAKRLKQQVEEHVDKAFPVRIMASMVPQLSSVRQQQELTCADLPQPPKLRKLCVRLNRSIVRNWLKEQAAAKEKQQLELDIEEISEHLPDEAQLLEAANRLAAIRQPGRNQTEVEAGANLSDIKPEKDMGTEAVAEAPATVSALAETAPVVNAEPTNNNSEAQSFGGTKMFSFLYPSRYQPSYGNVGLDYCCPNLDGPMRAIDPTRLHAKKEAPVLELPQFVVITTQFVSKHDKNIPEKVRAKLNQMPHKQGQPRVVQTLDIRSQATPAATSVATTAPRGAPAPTPTPIQSQPIVTGLDAQSQSKQLPQRTAVSKKQLPFGGNSSSSSGPAGQPALLQLQPICPTDKQSVELQTRVQLFDLVLQRLSRRAANLTLVQRHRTIEEFVRSSKLLPIDVEVGTKMLNNYMKYINLATNTTVSPLRFTSVVSPAQQSVPAQRFTMPAALPIYGPDNNIIGYKTASTAVMPAATTTQLVNRLNSMQPTKKTVVGSTLTKPLATSTPMAPRGKAAVPSTGQQRKATPTELTRDSNAARSTKPVKAASDKPVTASKAASDKPVAASKAASDKPVATLKATSDKPVAALKATSGKPTIKTYIRKSVANRTVPPTPTPAACDNVYVINQMSSPPEECILPDAVVTTNASQIKSEVED